MNLLRNLFEFDKPQTNGELIFFKAFELFIVLGVTDLAWSWGFYILRISDVVLPLGIARYVDVTFMFDHLLSLVNAALITGLAVAGFFRITKYAYLAALLLLHLQYAARYSLGEIPHSSNMLGMTLLGLCLAMLLFSDDQHRRRFTLGFTYFFVGLGYTLSAFCKLIGTGISWPDGRHLWMWINEKSIDSFAKTGVLDFNFPQELALSGHVIATFFLTVGLLTELFAFLVWWKKFRMPVLIGVVALHLGIYLVMNIFFTLSVYELVLLAFPWPAWLDWLTSRVSWMRILERVSIRYA
jgi:hypothetical protein